MTDTSTEAVDRLASNLERRATGVNDLNCRGAAALRAIAAERDAALARAERAGAALREIRNCCVENPTSQGALAASSLALAALAAQGGET
jgi:hypothetical protein